jgi:hypothetical protein
MENTETTTEVDNTSVTPESSDVAQDESNLTIDDLMSLSEDDFEEFKQEANHKGMKPLNEWMKHIPADARKHIANIRADYTRKTTEIAAMRKELENQKQAIMQQSKNIVDGPLAKRLAEVNTEEEYDLYDPKGMKAEIQRQAALMLKQMIEPAQQELQLNQRRIELDRFKIENPELTDPEYRGPIAELLQTRPELKLEDAFYIVKAKIGSQKVNAEKARLEADKAARRTVATKSSKGTAEAVNGTPKFKNAWDAYQWHRDNPKK